MTKEQVMKAMHEQKAVMVSGHDSIFAIVEVNLILNLATLVKLTDDENILTTMAKFEDIEVTD